MLTVPLPVVVEPDDVDPVLDDDTVPPDDPALNLEVESSVSSAACFFLRFFSKIV